MNECVTDVYDRIEYTYAGDHINKFRQYIGEIVRPNYSKDHYGDQELTNVFVSINHTGQQIESC